MLPGYCSFAGSILSIVAVSLENPRVEIWKRSNTFGEIRGGTADSIPADIRKQADTPELSIYLTQEIGNSNLEGAKKNTLFVSSLA